MAAAAPVPAGGLPSPRSPALSCADMILPEASERSFSPYPHAEPPPSPSELLLALREDDAASLNTVSSPYDYRESSIKLASPPLSSNSSRSTLRRMEIADGTPPQRNRLPSNETTIASSPTIADEKALQLRPSYGDDQRRLSDGSDSVHSDDLDKMVWPTFDGPEGADDSGIVLEESSAKEGLRDSAEADDELDNEQWLQGDSDGDEEGNTSAALSRRAEIILANAKKRLNVMEGNLRGARQSLVVSPTLNSMKMESALSHQLSIGRDRDRRLYAGQGPIPPRIRPFYSSPLSSSNSPGHSRGMSETLPIPISTYANRTLNQRASSAMSGSTSLWSPEAYGQGRFPIRESRSLEAVRDTRRGWDDRDMSLPSHENRGSISPSNPLETLPEVEDMPSRPPSTTDNLRTQMQDLRGRISSLKLKAKEDHMRRRSLQNLRTPSPFTCAETWYAASDAYNPATSPVTADAGVGTKTASPVRRTLFEEDEAKAQSEQAQQPRVESNGSAAASTQPDRDSDQLHGATGSHFEEQGQHVETVRGPFRYDFEDQEANDDEDEYEQDDEADTGGDSVYEDALYEMPVTERHEDRVDAFDYQNFFLHSAMGTYSTARSRSSSTSTDSVATTRPVTAVYDGDDAAKRVSMHQRNISVDSVSTVASFATAAEEQSDDEDDNEPMERLSQQLLNQQRHPQHHSSQGSLRAPRPDSAVNIRRAGTSPARGPSRGSSPGSDLASGLKTSKIYSVLLETTYPDEPRLALSEEEKQLVYALAASFQQVCANLQSTEGDQYERKEWRRRLDEARRVLNGEESEDDSF
ncbi:hypothetical protein M011DRAFT_459240 [Sporormia fimetaria CBS 119925]|uniref:Uncharacterized protein n=1 Tax=Sporormia fimetaria CBS 119925 TaxID=1340428 RepID=A0A6A6VBE6_9PLEO|nr:hypothetical protein M011DRAFT_459240 [Sporormia fimetaria CBS 119925]